MKQRVRFLSSSVLSTSRRVLSVASEPRAALLRLHGLQRSMRRLRALPRRERQRQQRRRPLPLQPAAVVVVVAAAAAAAEGNQWRSGCARPRAATA
jgi:hypothetical protein